MRDSVLLHRKAKSSKKDAGRDMASAREAWSNAAEQAQQAGRVDLVEKHQPDNRAGWGTIYMAIRKLQNEMRGGTL